jgi:serine/threonine protein kinase
VSSSLIGRKVGQYEIQALIGRGGMATVYLGYQPTIDRQVAIKVLPPHPGMEAGFVDRFQLEARTIARLQHPHILQLFDYGTQDDILYFVVPYIEGGSLERVMKKGPMDPLQVEKTLREVASALDYAHRQDVVHRDIKPGNILIDKEGHALLADFGIAKITGSAANLTGTGVVGTPAYMAPEQAQGIPEARSDIYSLGVVIYEMLTGMQPYRSENAMQVMLKHVQASIPSILDDNPNLPRSLEPVMMRVMAKEPDDRYWTASEFAEDFSRALHRGDSLAAIHRAFPLNPNPAHLPTEAYSRTNVLSVPDTGTSITPPVPQPTIIVQQSGVSTKALVAGFAGLALLIIAGIAFIAGQRPPIPDDADVIVRLDTPTAEIIATPETVAATDLPTAPTFGELSFGKINLPGDTLSLRLDNVAPPADGKVYVAWLVNTRDDTQVKMGIVAVDALGDGAVAYSDPSGIVLPTRYNAVIISEESSADADSPGENIRYSGSFPAEAMDTLNTIFIASEQGFQGSGLLESALREARFASQHAGLASGARDMGGVHTHAEHTINILSGTTADHDGNGSGSNPGTGIGLYAYVDAIDQSLLIATSAPTATRLLQTNAENIRVCLANIRLWSDQIIALEQEFIAAQDLAAIQEKLAESTTLADQLTNGFDQNENGQVEAFENECGLLQIERFGILISSMSIQEGALSES